MVGNSRLVTRGPEQSFFENRVAVMDGTIIKKVDILEKIKKELRDAEYVDAKGGAVIPTFISTYEHIYSAMARGLSIKDYDPRGFLNILDGVWWIIDRHLTGEQTHQNARATYLDSIKNGITTVLGHCANFGGVKGSLFTIGDAAKGMGVRVCLCYEISDRDSMDKARAAVMGNISWIKHALANDTDTITGTMGMHTQFTISDETVKPAAANKPIRVEYHIHVAEGIESLYDYPKKHSKRIVDRLMGCNTLGGETLLAHYVYVNPHEIQLIKDTDTMVARNLESNIGNAYGCPSTMEIVHRGILTGLGTDGYTHDMTESFKVASVLRKHHLCDANAAWGEVPQMLLKGNAKIANHYSKKQLGVLKEGAATDVIVTDYIPSTPMSAFNINGHILFGMAGRSVVTTVCNGKVLMKDRGFMGLDEEKIPYGVREKTKELTHSIDS